MWTFNLFWIVFTVLSLYKYVQSNNNPLWMICFAIFGGTIIIRMKFNEVLEHLQDMGDIKMDNDHYKNFTNVIDECEGTEDYEVDQ